MAYTSGSTSNRALINGRPITDREIYDIARQVENLVRGLPHYQGDNAPLRASENLDAELTYGGYGPSVPVDYDFNNDEYVPGLPAGPGCDRSALKSCDEDSNLRISDSVGFSFRSAPSLFLANPQVTKPITDFKALGRQRPHERFGDRELGASTRATSSSVALKIVAGVITAVAVAAAVVGAVALAGHSLGGSLAVLPKVLNPVAIGALHTTIAATLVAVGSFCALAVGSIWAAISCCSQKAAPKALAATVVTPMKDVAASDKSKDPAVFHSRF